MDWKYKHFNQQATFRAPRESVLEAARAVVAEVLGDVEETAEGFVAHGYSAFHPAIATFHVTDAPDGSQVAVELLVERAAMRGYMLFDAGGYYNGQIDKWFSGISQRLGGSQEHTVVRKTTSDFRVRQGCLAGCLVYLILGACLVILAIPIDHPLLPGASGSTPGPFTYLASGIGLVVGLGVFLYVGYPEAPASRFIRERLPGNRNRRGK